MHAFYAAIFAILLGLTVSIGDFKGLSLLPILFEVYILAFAMKVFIDDYIHFKVDKPEKTFETGILFSFAMWIMMMGAAIAAPKSIPRSAYYMITVNILGTVWIGLNHIGVARRRENRNKSVGWLLINCVHVFILSTILSFFPTGNQSVMVSLTIFLLFAILFDFIKYETPFRLIAAHKRAVGSKTARTRVKKGKP